MTLSARLSDLIAKLSGLPKGEAVPNAQYFRGDLTIAFNEAQALEEASSVEQEKALIAELQAQAKNNDSALKAATLELEAFRAEKKKREEEAKYPELNDEQFLVLRTLDTLNGKAMTVEEISQRCIMTLSDTNVHLSKMCEDKWVGVQCHNDGSAPTWHRTTKGDRYFMAKVMEDEATLPSIQSRILLLLLRSNCQSLNENLIHGALSVLHKQVTMEDVIGILNKLAAKGYVHRDPLEVTGGNGLEWVLMAPGTRYLAERGMK